jgi:hypothetical protein
MKRATLLLAASLLCTLIFPLTPVWSDTSPTIAVSQTNFSTDIPFHESKTLNVSFDVWNAGGGTLNFSLTTDQPSWISFIPTSDSSSGQPQTVNVSWLVQGVAYGQIFIGHINVIAPGATNSPQVITFTAATTIIYPTIAVDPESLVNACYVKKNAPSQTFKIYNGSKTWSESQWQVAFIPSWLSCSPASGHLYPNPSGSNQPYESVTVNYKTAGLKPGIYKSYINLQAPFLGLTFPHTIPVTLTVKGHNNVFLLLE